MKGPITRRDFLGTTGAAFAAASVDARLAAAPAPAIPSTAVDSPRPIRKALIYSMVRGNASVVEKFKLMKGAGFEGVEINQHLDPQEVRRAKEESGLIVHGVMGYDHWRLPLSDPDPSVRKAGRESMLGALRDCKDYGGIGVLLVPGKVTKTVPYADAYERSQDEVRKLVPVAADLKVSILIENVWNDMLCSPLEMARYIDEINSPWVASYFDVGNCVKSGWPEHWIAVLGKRIKKLHIKEFSRKLMNSKGPYAGFNLKIGDPGGDCDWPAVMQALDAVGFQGWASAEVPGGGPDELKDISRRLDRVLASGAVALK
jgi:L-ribulose-5-phosphate 3-epimerase